MNFTAKEQSRATRNYGIDLLRIVSMLLIPILHILGHGGVISTVQLDSINYQIVWFMELAAYCGVNCYALISGYVGYSSKHKYTNIIMLYLQVVFYSIVIFVIFILSKPELIIKQDVFSMLLPVSSRQYWFFTAYFCLALFSPFLNMILDNLEWTTARRLLITIALLFVVLPTVFHYDIFYTGEGYSALWLSMLYLIGGCINKFDIGKRGKAIKYFVGYFACVTITWLIKMKRVHVFTGDWFSVSNEGDFLVAYTSPTILFAAIFLLIGFRNLNFGKLSIKIISFFAPLTFGVYLIHENPIIRRWIITDRFQIYSNSNPIILIGIVLGTTVFIWLSCSLIDRIRLSLFKALKVSVICTHIEKIIENMGRKIINDRE